MYEKIDFLKIVFDELPPLPQQVYIAPFWIPPPPNIFSVHTSKCFKINLFRRKKKKLQSKYNYTQMRICLAYPPILFQCQNLKYTSHTVYKISMISKAVYAPGSQNS